MSRAKTHPQVEFAVDDKSGQEHIFHTPDEAAAVAISLCLSDGRDHNIDVLVYSKEGAEWYRGSFEGVDEYLEDPEASVFERIVIHAESIGRVT